MSHDKTRAAARRRMARTGEPYTAARRAVAEDRQAADAADPPPGDRPPGDRPADTRWFAISYGQAAWEGRLTAWLDTLLFRTGPDVSGVEVSSDEVRVRMGEFTQTIPRSSVRVARRHRSSARVGRTTGVHVSRGRLLVNGSSSIDDLVELAIEPPCYTRRTLSTGFAKAKVNVLILSLANPDGFIAALTGPGARRQNGCDGAIVEP